MCLAYTHYASVDIDAVGTDGFTLRTSSRQTKLTLSYRSKLQWSSQGQVPPNRRPTAVDQQLFRVRALHTCEQNLGIAVQLPKARPLQTCDEPRVDDGQSGRYAGGVRNKARMWTGGKHGNWTVMPEPRKPDAVRRNPVRSHRSFDCVAAASAQTTASAAEMQEMVHTTVVNDQLARLILAGKIGCEILDDVYYYRRPDASHAMARTVITQASLHALLPTLACAPTPRPRQ